MVGDLGQVGGGRVERRVVGRALRFLPSPISRYFLNFSKVSFAFASNSQNRHDPVGYFMMIQSKQPAASKGC